MIRLQSRMRLSAVILLWFSFVNICVTQASDEYLIQPGDVLSIAVWKEQDLQRELLVQPDGRFSFPLIGEVNTLQKTVSAVQAELQQRLSKYIADPVVTASVVRPQGNKVFVIGKVNRPGEFLMGARTDVVQALSMAGGATTFANVSDIKILRRNAEGEQQAIKFNYNQIEKGKNLAQNIILLSGDIVIVP